MKTLHNAFIAEIFAWVYKSRAILLSICYDRGMKRLCVFFVFILLSCCNICVHSQPFKGGLRPRLITSALHPRVALARIIAKKRTKKYRPIHFRSLPVSDNLKRAPVFPLSSHPHEMYRGLALDSRGKELRNIVHEGMAVKKSHFPVWHGTYDGKKYPADTKALFATTDPLLASIYAQMNRFREDGNLFLPVVLHLKRVGKDVDNGRARTIEIPHDIPPSWIEKISTLLNVDGQLRWGELKLDGEDGFLFTPYPSLP